MLAEFKKFAMRGNVMDMAVGVIIGGAFGKIVTSLVNDVFMPLIGILLGGVDFAELETVVGEATVKYGLFIQTIVDFLIIAFVVFLFVKGINSRKKQEEEKPKAPPAPPREQVLLEEIRDLLQQQKTSA